MDLVNYNYRDHVIYALQRQMYYNYTTHYSIKRELWKRHGLSRIARVILVEFEATFLGFEFRLPILSCLSSYDQEVFVPGHLLRDWLQFETGNTAVY